MAQPCNAEAPTLRKGCERVNREARHTQAAFPWPSLDATPAENVVYRTVAQVALISDQ